MFIRKKKVQSESLVGQENTTAEICRHEKVMSSHTPHLQRPSWSTDTKLFKSVFSAVNRG